MNEEQLKELIQYLDKQINEYKNNLNSIKGNDEFKGFCRGMITGFKYVKGALKQHLK